MDTFLNILIEWGYVGLFISAFLAGSIIPFSSEAVLVALIYPSVGLNPTLCVLLATAGNTMGGLTCYWLGHLGKMEWLVKYFKVNPDKLERMQTYLNGRSALFAFFVCLPFIGDLIAIALGFLRSNIYVVSISMFAGKLLKYALIALATLGIFNLIG